MKRLYLHPLLLLALAALVLPAVARAKDRDRFQVVEATIDQIHAAFRSGNLSPEELVDAYLARIAAFDRAAGQPLHNGTGQQPFNSFMHVNPRADDFDGGEGDEDGGTPLAGIPVILKDNIATKDMPTTAGSVALGGSRPKRDAFIARKLRRAGAIILGKGTLTEFANFIALGMPTGFSSQLRFQLFQNGGDLSKVGFGFNAYDPRVDPRNVAPVNDGRPILATGGSSSGPGIAVGANLATVGVGTETSGSILSPSGQNSLVGIKPTLGLVSRHGIVPITADQDTAGPMARTVTDAAKLLGVLAGFDPDDPATAPCRTPGKCFSDYTKFLNANALTGAHIAVPRKTFFIDFGLGAARTALMERAIVTMTSLGATFEECEIPSQNVLNNYGTCVTAADVARRRATPAGAIPACSTVLMFGFKRDLNSYLADKDFGPGVSASSSSIPVRTVHSLSDVVSFNAAHPEVAQKYGQAIAEGSDILNTGPGDDLRNYQADRALDLKLTRTCGLDILYTGVVPKECAGLVADQGSCAGKKFDAVLFPANFGANAPARAGYPSVIVPGGFFQPNPPLLPPGFVPNKSPFGVTFSGPAFSEPKLIGYAYAYEQATHNRLPPASAPALAASDR